MTKREIIYRLKAGTVVDRALFNALTNDKLVATTAELFADPSKPPMFVDNSLEFFSKKNLMNEVMTAGPNLNILLERQALLGRQARLLPQEWKFLQMAIVEMLLFT